MDKGLINGVVFLDLEKAFDPSPSLQLSMLAMPLIPLLSANVQLKCSNASYYQKICRILNYEIKHVNKSMRLKY